MSAPRNPYQWATFNAQEQVGGQASGPALFGGPAPTPPPGSPQPSAPPAITAAPPPAPAQGGLTTQVQGTYKAPGASILGQSIGQTTQGNTYGMDRGVTGYTAGQAGYQTAGYEKAGLTTAGYQTYDPFTRTVDANTETVQGQLNSIIKADSPLMQLARSRAIDQAAKRGLGSSSIAVGAAQRAVMDTAIPIAQQDAETYTVAAQNNQQAINEAREFGADAYNQTEQFNAREANQTEQFNVREGNETQRFNVEQGNFTNRFNVEQGNKALQFGADSKNQVNLADINNAAAMERTVYSESQATARNQATISANMDMAALDRASRESLTSMEMNNRRLIQGSQSASSVFTQGTAEIGAIQRDPNLTDEGKARAIQQVQNNMRAGLDLASATAGVDMGGTINFSAPSYAPTVQVSNPSPPSIPRSPTNPNGLPWFSGGGNDG